jgi:hypothetical protein
MKNKIIADETAETNVDLDRRRALARLGLGLSAAYAVPALLTLSRGAHASSGDGGSGGGSGGDGGGDPSGGDPSGGDPSGGDPSDGTDGVSGSEDPAVVSDSSGPSIDP